jgi:hypothetical protein
MSVALSIACPIHDRRLAEAYLLHSLASLDGDAPVPFLLDNDDNSISRNLAHLYNVLARLEGPPVRIFTHADVTFPADFGQRIASAVAGLEGRGIAWGALGTVGRSWQGEYVWGHEVDEPTEVCTVDACCVVIDTRQRTSFDEHTFDGFHCHVEDYCMQCHASGLGVFVIPSQLDHIGATYALEGSRWGQYPKYRKRLARKWRRQFPGLTTT